MAVGAIITGAQAVGQAGTNDPNVGRAAPFSAQVSPSEGLFGGGFRKDPRTTAAKVLDPGAVFLKGGKPKFKKFEPASISDLTSQARDTFRANQEGFLADQLAAQRGQFRDFFDLQSQTLEQGRSLIDRLTTGDLERRITTGEVRSAQAARGLSLSPAAAIQEGLAVSRAQQESEFNALGLGQQLAQFSATTPLQLQQLDFSQLLSQAGQIDLAKGGFATDAQISNINLQRDQSATSAALLGRLAGSFGSRQQPQQQGFNFQQQPDQFGFSSSNPSPAVTTTQGGFTGAGAQPGSAEAFASGQNTFF